MRLRLLTLVVLSLRLAAIQGPEGTATVRGRVVDAVTGRPLRGATIYLNFHPRPPYGSDAAQPPNRTTSTDANGSFTIGLVAAGDYDVSGGRDDNYLRIVYGGSSARSRSRVLSVSEHAQLDIEIRAWPAASVSGHVLDERGRPIAGAAVRIVPRAFDLYKSDTTDDTGAYSLRGLPPGEYSLVVPVTLSSRTLADRAATGPVPARPQDALQALVDRDGRTVLLTWLGLPPPASPEGPPSVFVTSFYGGRPEPTFFALAPGQAREDVDIALAARRGTRVSGSVTVPQGTVSGVILRLDSPAATDSDLEEPGIMATADASGRFVFVAAPEGAYRLRAMRRTPPLTAVDVAGGSTRIAQDDWVGQDEQGLWADMPLTVGPDEIGGLDVEMRPATPISGRVVFDDPEGAPARADSIEPVMVSTRPDSVDTRSLRLHGDGTFTAALRPGRYMLQMRGGPGRWRLTAATLDGSDVADGPFVVGTDPISGLELTLARAATTVRGSVTNREGRPLGAGTVIAFPADRDRWIAVRAEESLSVRMQEVKDGAYEISGLMPGHYYLAAVDDDVNGWLLPALFERLAARAARLELRPREAAVQNLTASSLDRP